MNGPFFLAKCSAFASCFSTAENFMYQAFGLLHTALQMHQVGILLEDFFLNHL
jgi:hypothetical protein